MRYTVGRASTDCSWRTIVSTATRKSKFPAAAHMPHLPYTAVWSAFFIRYAYAVPFSHGSCSAYRPPAVYGRYTNTRAVAWAAIAVFALGVPLGTLALLFHVRDALTHGRSTPLTRATQFIHREYRPTFFWFEVVEVLRKGYFVGFAAVIFTPGTISQLATSSCPVNTNQGPCVCHSSPQLTSSCTDHRD